MTRHLPATRAQELFEAGAERRAQLLRDAEAKRGYSLRNTDFLRTLEAVDRQFAIQQARREVSTVAVDPTRSIATIPASCPAAVERKPGAILDHHPGWSAFNRKLAGVSL